MKDRPRLELRPLLTVWNTILAVFRYGNFAFTIHWPILFKRFLASYWLFCNLKNFICFPFISSIMGALRSWPEFLYLFTTHGFYHTVCISTMYKGVSGFWTYLFVMSKLIELGKVVLSTFVWQDLSLIPNWSGSYHTSLVNSLIQTKFNFLTGDTLFIILRKQQLIFLHWYHHITVLCYVWYSYMDHTAPGQWFLVMNYTVHALMYTYYAFRSMKFKISKWVSGRLSLGGYWKVVASPNGCC